ncbi:hypothetical protein [Siminovitchia fordii]|uniref:Uncharacterized protein n=1 Tax=Siminovitchia fordii TaxID=254759 RepID=A0ABQ4K9Z0_9BACI|nr:hypothetical protein [Siminovitchia fordii]GIN22531.1 hypothetical protein J1TS3_36650 [Siminovitchia fordii]
MIESARAVGEALKRPLRVVIESINVGIKAEQAKQQDYDVFSQEYRESIEREIALLNEKKKMLQGWEEALTVEVQKMNNRTNKI